MSEPKTVREIELECIAWERNCLDNSLKDRIKFQKWLYKTFDPVQLAVMLDMDVQWEVLWDTWLNRPR